jgi:signal transduction histidine kinase/ActR/RegA family two-component response regulator
MNDTVGDVPSFLAGGGEAGALVRALDWSRTPVGPVERWSASLKAIVGTMLHSRHPMFLWWGPELIQFYNDAYLPSFRHGKHPAAMGQRGADCWQEIWPIIWPQIDDVMQRGMPSWNEDHLVPIVRNDRLEEVYWTYGYSPVFDDDGAIGGTLVVCTETTGRVLASRRLKAMRALAESSALATDWAGLLDRAAEVLAKESHDIPFALVYETVAGAPRVARRAGIDAETATALDARFGADVRVFAASGSPRPMLDLEVTGTAWPEPVTQVFCVPIGTGAHATGYVLVGLSPRLAFDAPYREFLQQIGEQMADGQGRIQAFHQQALVEAERNSLLEQAPVATALLTGPNHVYQLANPRYLRMVGRTDLVGKAYLEAFPELAGTPALAALDTVFRTGQPFATEEMHAPIVREGADTPDDAYFKFNLEPLRDASGRVYGMMAVAVDLTAQVRARKEIERAQAERERLLRELEAASRAKDEFLAMLGHELRNPLSPILTALDLMRMRGERGGENEREIIERQVRHMVQLVDDLLDVSRITRGLLELRRTRVPLLEVVAKAVEQVDPLIAGRKHRLEVDVPADLIIDVDERRMSQVLTNLLSNAAKYTEPGGTVVLRARRHDDHVLVHVRDTGIGIAPEVMPCVFDMFAQARQKSDRALGGLGLGLTIVKSLVEAHGGTVSLHSEGTGRGTEAILRLPMSAAGHASPTSPADEPAPRPTDGCRVLLVDDNRDAADLLAESLRIHGHEVEVAYDGPSALHLARSYVPDVALLDLGLPVIDGYELAVRLRREPGWAGVRLVALTGYGQERDRERTGRAGFEEHLTKPADVPAIDATVRRLAGLPVLPSRRTG